MKKYNKFTHYLLSKRFWGFKASRILLNNWGSWGLVWFVKYVIYNLDMQESLWGQIQMSYMLTFLDETLKWRFEDKQGLNNIFSNISGISGFQTLGLQQKRYMEPFYAILFVGVFVFALKQVPICLSCSGECCNVFLPWSSANFTKLHLAFLQNWCRGSVLIWQHSLLT